MVKSPDLPETPERPVKPQDGASRSKAPTLAARRREQRIALAIHRTIGLVFGALFVLVGLSGSILAFRHPIDEWLNAKIMHVAVPVHAAYRPLDELLAAARSAAPSNSLPERLSLPRHSGLAAAATFMVTTDELETELHEVFVDPYSAEVTGTRILLRGDRPLSQPLIRIVMDFHWTLLLGPNRAYIIGITAIFIFVSVFVGVFLWWPRNGNWRHAVTIKWGATRERIVYDVHKTIGLYLSAALMVMLITGCAMIFKPQTRSVVALFSPLHQERQYLGSVPRFPPQPLGLDVVAAIADTVFPDGKLYRILLPAGPTSVFVVGKQADDEPNRSTTSRNVTIDQYSGRILHVQDREDFTAGDRLLEWLFPLHCGEAFGTVGRALVMLVGLAPLILYVTGFLRWWQKRCPRRGKAS
jgi:uncharacterized iron-regulated membrane protein